MPSDRRAELFRPNEAQASPSPVAWAVAMGALGGIAAGLALLALELSLAGFLEGDPLRPLRSLAALAVGGSRAQVGAVTALAVGLPLGALVAVVLGIATALVVAHARRLGRSPSGVVAFSASVGLLLWIVRATVLVPFLGAQGGTAAALALHAATFTLGYGVVLGLVLASRLPGVTEPASPAIPSSQAAP